MKRSNTTGTGGVKSPGNLAKGADGGTGGEYPTHAPGPAGHRELGTPVEGMPGQVAKGAGGIRQNTPGHDFSTSAAPDAISGASEEQKPPTDAVPIRQHTRMAGGG